MDRELRELERRAATGDRWALYQLLMRRGALADYNLSELNRDTRRALALELAISFRNELEGEHPNDIIVSTATLWAEIFMDSDPDLHLFFTTHLDRARCPECGSRPYMYSEMTLNQIRHSEEVSTVLDGLLRCRCGSKWRSPEIRGLLNEDISGLLAD